MNDPATPWTTSETESDAIAVARAVFTMMATALDAVPGITEATPPGAFSAHGSPNPGRG